MVASTCAAGHVDSFSLPAGTTSRFISLPEADSLPIWSTKTSTNSIACHAEYKDESNGWVIMQWKNDYSLCIGNTTTKSPKCDSADSVRTTKSATYCHWNEDKTVFLALNAKEMNDHGCNPNANGNEGGYVAYLAWNPKILREFYKQPEQYMVGNMEDIVVRFKFYNKYLDQSYVCSEQSNEGGEGDHHVSAIAHSYMTATFSEIDPETNKGTGRTIFYQILNFDNREKVVEQMLNGTHGYMTCNYKNGTVSTMIYRDSVTDFGEEVSLPESGGNNKYKNDLLYYLLHGYDEQDYEPPLVAYGEVDYEFPLLAKMKGAISYCYEDADPGNFKFAGMHIGTEIRNGARHEFYIENPEIEIIYKPEFIVE